MLGLPSCPRCRGPVSLHAGRPKITAGGVIELWCATCFDLGPLIEAPIEAAPVAIAVAISAPAKLPQRRRWPLVAGSAAGALAIALALGARGGAAETAIVDETIAIDEPVDDEVAPAIAISHEDPAPVRPAHVMEVDDDTLARWPVPADDDGTPLDEVYTSLADWTHPVVDSPEPAPAQASRWFGAARVGLVPRPECGLGHCGVDLDGPRGRPVVAVASAIVVRIERSELGRDKRSGRYVRLQHEDGTLTSYMHLDEIADGLEVGDRVVGGQEIGLLGATAVYKAAPHLHFDLAIPNQRGERGDTSDVHYVDPMPFLARATVVTAPDRRRPQKANW
ncbi:MAG: M23 family metallopeptidase [Deltaproteobacteria bacterium]|nr:M23 family metallopeptidase [Deltaproteobacteria bacterium]